MRAKGLSSAAKSTSSRMPLPSRLLLMTEDAKSPFPVTDCEVVARNFEVQLFAGSWSRAFGTFCSGQFVNWPNLFVETHPKSSLEQRDLKISIQLSSRINTKRVDHPSSQPKMLRLSVLSRVFAPAPLRIGRRGGHRINRFATAKPPQDDNDNDDDGDDDEEHGYHEEDFDDMEFDDDDEDDDDMDFEDDNDDEDFADMEWMELGNPQFINAADRKVEEHVKQKVRVQRAKHSKRRFVDRIRIKATGGHGGNGCASFFSESAMRKRPNGGHGGAGGNVVIEADDRIQNLANATHHFKGGAGLNGMPNDSAGRRGKHCFVKVPCGTLVKRVKRFERELENGEFEIVDKMETVCDLDQPGATFLAAIGGKPGLGNRILAGKTTNFGRLRKHMPESKGTGSPGTSQYYELELKTIADVGLVGYPNAGKSTLLSTLSRATPEIAPYPFTTLHPYVGIVEFPDTYRLSVADIPGLIEGAHRNVGLGHDFLRHIERTKILMYVLDTAGTEGRDPISDFKHLQHELELYAPNITTRPSLIIANKMDEAGAETNLHKLRKATDMAVLPVSALHKLDIDSVARTLRWMMENYSKLTKLS